MAEVIGDLEEQSAYDYLKRLTDIHRLHLFDVVMQYRAIFSDDQSAQVSFQSMHTHLVYALHPSHTVTTDLDLFYLSFWFWIKQV